MGSNEAMLFVDTGTAAVRAARATSRRIERQRLDGILDNLHQLYFADRPGLDAVERYSRRATRRLRTLATAPAGDSDDEIKRQAAAVVLLWHLGDTGSRHRLRESLRTGMPRSQVAILDALRSLSLHYWYHSEGLRRETDRWRRSRRFRRNDVLDVTRELLGSNDPDVVRAASRWCMTPEDALERARADPAACAADLLLRAANAIGAGHELLRIAADRLRTSGNHFERHLLISTLGALIRHKDPRLKAATGEELTRFLEWASPSDAHLAQQTLQVQRTWELTFGRPRSRSPGGCHSR